MPLFVNPFKKRGTPHFPEVVVPLPRGGSPRPGSGKGDARSPSPDEKGEDVAPNYPGYVGTTMESLREEVENGLVASGHDTVYDRTFTTGVFDSCHLTAPGISASSYQQSPGYPVMVLFGLQI